MSREKPIKSPLNFIIIISVFIILFIVGGIWFVSQKMINANLKTYNNKEFGFEFQYDKDSEISVINPRPNNYDPHLLMIRIKNQKLIETLVENNKPYESNMSETYFDFSVDEESKCPVNTKGFKNEKISKIRLANTEADLIEGDVAYNSYAAITCLKHNGYVYIFSNTYYRKSSQNVQNLSKQLFRQILSTFKFTN